MEYPELDKLNSSNCTERSMELHYPEFWKYIIENYHYGKWTERLYWFYHDLKEYPKCKVCGQPTKFINIKTGYREFCSSKCSNNDFDKKDKTKQTCLEKYGGIAPASSINIREKMMKTNIRKYGVKNVQQLSEISEKSTQTCLKKYGGRGNSSKLLKEKYVNTCNQQYGVDNPMQNNMIKEKFKLSILSKYNVDHPSKLKDVKKKIQQSRRKTEMFKHPFIKGYTDEGNWICKCPHEGCNKCESKTFIISNLIYECRQRQKTEICTNILPVGLDYTKNTSIELFIQNLLEQYNIEYQTNTRTIISPKELDIYIPSKNIAIECNGVYSHSIKYKQHNYHTNKSKLCQENNIKLIHIWEDWVKNKPEIIESVILNKLGLLKTNNIYARKTFIKEIDSKTCNDFLSKNHIQGKSQSTIRLGLYYNDELVSVMTFSKPRINMGGKEHKCQWELVRFCSKLNTRVVGGASKLLNHFIKQYNPKSIVSFSMNDISDGNLYKQLGFESDGKITTSYWYIEPGTFKRYHRTSFSKREIVKKGFKDKIDNTWTERSAMEEVGYFCIYDSGQLKWELNL